MQAPRAVLVTRTRARSLRRALMLARIGFMEDHGLFNSLFVITGMTAGSPEEAFRRWLSKNPYKVAQR